MTNVIQVIEEWKDIPQYEGLYQASNFGNIKSLERKIFKKNGRFDTTTERILKPGITSKGYHQVSLSKDTKSKTFRVNRLVAITFIPNPDKYPIVNHKDGNKANNILSNLEWCSFSYNVQHGYDFLGRVGKSPMQGRIGKANHLSKPVNQYTVTGDLIKTWDSISCVHRSGVPYITNVLLGKQKSAGGYLWKYAKI